MTSRTTARFQFAEHRVAAIVFLLMLAPVASVIAILQLFVPTEQARRVVTESYTLLDTPQLDMYVLYLTSAVVHIIVSVVVILFLRRRLRDNISTPKHRVLVGAMAAYVASIIVVFLLCDALDPTLALLSHERVYAILERSPLFSPYFVHVPGALVGKAGPVGFYLFSLLPGGLIILGLIVIVLTCFSIGRDLVFIRRSLRGRLNAGTRQSVDGKIRAFQSYFYLLSAVLMSSTIATALFFRLPLTSIGPGEAYTRFDALSTAMTICWGVTFSLTMFAMCFYPYFRIQRDLRHLLIESRIAKNDDLQKWLHDVEQNYVIYTNLKSLLSMSLPAVVAVLSTFV